MALLGSARATLAGDGERTVVAELFTSQGCSSCPPADALLAELVRRSAGPRVIGLSFHVDYWNRLGWRDPFSAAAWSERQSAYARVLERREVYTPQLVIGGTAECVGSDRACVERALRSAARRQVSARVAITSVTRAATSWRVVVEVDGPDGATGVRLLVALYERDLVTEVARGENAHRTLRNENVVRRLESRVLPEGGVVGVDVDVDSRFREEKLGVVAFLQEQDSMRIVAAAAWSIETPSGE